jgi:hypothetical protein
LRKEDVFKSRDEAREYLSSRRIFSTMDPEVFDIFINECLVPCSAEHNDTAMDNDKGKEKSVQLYFGKKEEIEIYHKVPYEVPLLSKHFLNQYGMDIPGKYYYTKGKYSILQPSDYQWVEANYNKLKCEEYGYSHFWPIENIENFSDVMAKDVVDIFLGDLEN